MDRLGGVWFGDLRLVSLGQPHPILASADGTVPILPGFRHLSSGSFLGGGGVRLGGFPERLNVCGKVRATPLRRPRGRSQRAVGLTHGIAPQLLSEALGKTAPPTVLDI